MTVIVPTPLPGATVPPLATARPAMVPLPPIVAPLATVTAEGKVPAKVSRPAATVVAPVKPV